ncbi:patatin [Permianibacter sp. IMCC34836]|uniref:patatin-like phospholipase family protein n=1 Tax=Permianibacter fluminis TaxID=2738515 RepID=UPI001557CD5A|nr:patatin-like phospholipase family protein [Permianibacter fluminis]NQD36309.1 patatin [Permianibacter fluminis]
MAGITLRDWLAEQPYTLTLGSGFFGFFGHFGVLKALLDAGLPPARLTGASSGALVAACYASGMSIEAMQQLLFTMKRQDFWDPGWAIWRGGLLKGEQFRAQMRATFPSTHFDALQVPLALSVYNASRQRTEVIDSGDLVDATYASCALPVLFQPLRRNGETLLDGGVKDRPALAAVADDERVLIHHLAAKSPWRRADDPALRPPQRGNGTTLVLVGLTRCSPFKLERGSLAFAEAYATTTARLAQPWQPLMSGNVHAAVPPANAVGP